MRARKMLALSWLLVMVGGISLAAGCSSSSKGDTSASADQAMYCSKCETVWVNERTSANPRIVTYGPVQKMVCADCDEQAKAALTSEGEVVLHDCDMCKVKPTMVDRNFRPASSNRKG